MGISRKHLFSLLLKYFIYVLFLTRLFIMSALSTTQAVTGIVYLSIKTTDFDVKDNKK